jgi:predicted dehydrogenase
VTGARPPTRIALLGAGLIGREHAALLSRHPEIDLIAIADPTPAATELAANLGARHFAEFGEMLEATKPDGAIVALPNELHLAAGLACVQHGVPCLMEKPVAASVEAGLRLASASESAGVPILVGHQRRHSPDLREAKRLLEDGVLGDLVAVSGMYLVDKPDDYFRAEWRRMAGGGPILINLIHDIDALRFVCGEIRSVRAFVSNRVRQFAVEDTASLCLEFESGALGTFVLSDAVASPWSWDITSNQALYFPHQPGAHLFLGGRKASLSVSDMQLWRHANEGEHWQHPFVRQFMPGARSSAYLAQLDHFLAVIRREAKPVIDARDATTSLAATLAVARAAAEDRTVTIEEMLDAAASQISGQK